jgi:hypothetical protein
VKRALDTAGGMLGVAVALIVTGVALLTAPVWVYVMWRNDRKRAAR